MMTANILSLFSHLLPDHPQPFISSFLHVHRDARPSFTLFLGFGERPVFRLPIYIYSSCFSYFLSSSFPLSPDGGIPLFSLCFFLQVPIRPPPSMSTVNSSFHRGRLLIGRHVYVCVCICVCLCVCVPSTKVDASSARS